ncbi:hypothetical protein BCAR13_710150 [Paraburkholderia caribensis]|nr:hypothetical protein BCAR13_710150 [Paraburkholderia caribensis]
MSAFRQAFRAGNPRTARWETRRPSSAMRVARLPHRFLRRPFCPDRQQQQTATPQRRAAIHPHLNGTLRRPECRPTRSRCAVAPSSADEIANGERGIALRTVVSYLSGALPGNSLRWVGPAPMHGRRIPQQISAIAGNRSRYTV